MTANKQEYLYTNAKIFTANPAMPFAEAMSVADGRIKWIGAQKDAPSTAGITVDLQGQRVLPGLIDAHMHPLFLAECENQIACTQPAVNSIADIIEEIKKWRAQKGAGVWLEGWGFDEGKLAEQRTPTRYDLDKGSPDDPVIIGRTCVHIFVANSKALELAGIDRNTPDPKGGAIDRDEHGEPTGILRESARELVYRIVPTLTADEQASALAKLSTKLLSYGITAVTDMSARLGEQSCYELYTDARKKGFKQRAALYPIQWDFAADKEFDEHWTDRNNPIFVGGVKVLADGSVSGRTAWVSESFLGEDDAYGMPTITADELRTWAGCAERNKVQLVVHAMGDKAIDLITETFDGQKSWLENQPSIRIEHAAMPTERALKTAAETGIAFVTQPIFQYAEIESYLKNLGLKRTQSAYPIRTIMNAGVKLAFSSDAPATAWAEPADPFVALKAATTRLSYDGTDCGQDHRVDIGTAIELYTRAAQEIVGIPDIGQLKTGYHADFIILSEDVFSLPPVDLDRVKVAATYMAGEKIY